MQSYETFGRNPNAVEGGDLSVQQPGGSEVDTAVHLMRSVSSTM